MGERVLVGRVLPDQLPSSEHLDIRKNECYHHLSIFTAGKEEQASECPLCRWEN